MSARALLGGFWIHYLLGGNGRSRAIPSSSNTSTKSVCWPSSEVGGGHAISGHLPMCVAGSSLAALRAWDQRDRRAMICLTLNVRSDISLLISTYPVLNVIHS